ncbi:hypothetical protein RP726_02805 [Candidatus Methylospira mobilis]|uniref:hypothetical protein n=1 Tax=Candidatus Methylospira mobilis TaxID=1808979 RepID=UPI0028ED7003|nr:hypothetical protein [Candidatus Methylospira mobilis]WNV05351.1 hypothetical protein RP726_02805 [Candidatus Methylospira mobilis]
MKPQKPTKKQGILIGVALITGLGLTLIGLESLTWSESVLWEDSRSWGGFLGFLAVAAIVIGLLAQQLKLTAGLAVLMAATLLALLAGAIGSLLVAAWFAGACSMVGYWCLGKLRVKDRTFLDCFLAGAGIYGSAVGILAHFPVNYPGVYAVALTLPFLAGWRTVVDEGGRLLQLVDRDSRNRAETEFKWLDVAIGVVALVYFVFAMMPEVGYDALVTHLFVPAHMALRHQWGFDVTTYVWAVVPMLGDWIFSMGYMLGGETAARFINVGFIFVLGWLVRDCVQWAGGSLVGARWAVLVFLSTPLTFTVGCSLYIESIWASFVVAGCLAVLRACSSSPSFGKPGRNELLLSGLLLGCGAAVKAITFTVLPGIMLLLIWRFRTWFKTVGLQSLAGGIGLFLATGGIPYATAWWLTGSPVFPLFNRIFKSPYFGSSENFTNSNYNGGLTWDVLYRVTFDTVKYLEAYAGASGFQWLLLFIPALITLFLYRRIRGGAMFLVAVIAIAVLFHWQSYLRYAFPSWVILTAVIGVGLGTVITTQGHLSKLCCFSLVITVMLNLLFINVGRQTPRDFPLLSMFQSYKDNYLQTRLPIRNAVELVNRLNVERTPVAVFAEPLTAGLSGDALYPNWYNIPFLQEVNSIHDEKDIAAVFKKHRVNFIILDENWSGGSCGPKSERQALIEKASEPVAMYDYVSVRKIKDGNRHVVSRSMRLVVDQETDADTWYPLWTTGVPGNANLVTVKFAKTGTQFRYDKWGCPAVIIEPGASCAGMDRRVDITVDHIDTQWKMAINCNGAVSAADTASNKIDMKDQLGVNGITSTLEGKYPLAKLFPGKLEETQPARKE